MMSKVEIKGSFWITLRNGTNLGIVVTYNGFEEKAYIGIAAGVDQKKDEENIARIGSKFPLKQAKELI